MSTRANVRIKDKDSEILLYHHHDGYPSGVGADLQRYIKEMLAIDGFELDARSIADYLKDDERGDEYRVDEDQTLHGDIEFLYIVNTVKRTICCYSVDMFDPDMVEKGEQASTSKLAYTSSFGDTWNEIEKRYPRINKM